MFRKKWVCNTCGRRFRTQWGVDRHADRLGQNKPYRHLGFSRLPFGFEVKGDRA